MKGSFCVVIWLGGCSSVKRKLFLHETADNKACRLSGQQPAVTGSHLVPLHSRVCRHLYGRYLQDTATLN